MTVYAYFAGGPHSGERRECPSAAPRIAFADLPRRHVYRRLSPVSTDCRHYTYVYEAPRT